MTRNDLINLTNLFNDLKIYINTDKSLKDREIAHKLNKVNHLQQQILISDKVLKNSLNDRIQQ